MAKLHELQERRAHAVSEMQAINDKVDAEARDYSEAEDKRHKELKSEIAGLDRQIARAADLQEATRAAPAILHHGHGDGSFEERAREYSLLKAIAHQIPGSNVDAGKEIEISRELERRCGRAAVGLLAPTAVFEKRADNITTTTPAAGPGSNLIRTDLLSGQWIDILRASMVSQRLGARVLSNLVGNVAIPRLKASATGHWVAEDSAITVSDLQSDQVTLSPKHCGAIVEYSRNMVLQSSPDIEQLVRTDFAALLARALDSAAIRGGGTNEPSGILASGSGVTDVPGGASGAAIDYDNIIACISAVSGDNALAGSLGFATNSLVVKKCCTTLKSSADTASNFIMPNPGAGTLAGYALATSNLVPGDITKNAVNNLSALIFGDWSQLLVGYWSSFDILTNPYAETPYSKGNIQTRGMLTADVAIRQPKAFAKIADIITT